jgi:hypothetical protein
MKSFVESEYRIPMAQQTLLYEDKPMMNPMSLLDYLREAKGAGCWWGVWGGRVVSLVATGGSCIA